MTDDFIFAQVSTRLLVLMMQVLIMVGAGVLFFHLHFIGSLFNMMTVALLGGVVFLSIAIEGATLTEVLPQLLGLAVWSVITLFIAIKAFRWE